MEAKRPEIRLREGAPSPGVDVDLGQLIVQLALRRPVFPLGAFFDPDKCTISSKNGGDAYSRDAGEIVRKPGPG